MISLIDSNKEFKDAVDVFKALADETRFRIMQVLSCGSFNVNEIKEILGMGQSRISRHLKILADAGLLSYNREGSWVYYSILEPSKEPKQKVSDSLVQWIQIEQVKYNWREIDKANIEKVIHRRNEKQNIFFNNLGREWESIQKEILNPELYRNIITSYLPKKNKHILDLGCGPGGLVPYLLDKSNKVTGIDSSPKMIEDAQKLFASEKRVQFIQSYLETIPIKTNSVNAVIASMVLHHISKPPVVLEEAFRVLSDDGILCIVDLLKHEKEFMRDKFSDLWLGFEKEQLQDWLNQSGFNIKNTQQLKVRDFEIIIINSIKRRTTNVRSKRKGK